MTIFGTTLDGGQIASVVLLLATLALWVGAFGQERNYSRWFKEWEAGRKARHEAQNGGTSKSPDKPRTGPWG